MDSKTLDHAYHRSRVDAHISGSIAFILLMLILAFMVGDKFKPFQQGVDMWSSTILVWQPDTNAWISPPASLLRSMAENERAPLITKEIYPRCYSLVVLLGSLVASYFLYSCAKRQTVLMHSVYKENDERASYDRTWSELRVTFWALFMVLLGALFLFMM